MEFATTRKVPTESAEEGMRRELAVEEPTETAGNLAFYASSVSASAATFPMGDGLDRAILNYSKITTALRWLHKSPYFSGQCTPRALPTAMLKPHLRGAARRGKGISGAPQPT